MWSPGRTLPTLRSWLADWGGRVALGLAAYIVGYALWTLLAAGESAHAVLISDLAFIPVTGTAALLAWRVARDPACPPSAAAAWGTIALAFLVYWIGDLLFIYFELVLATSPFPSVADLAYLSYTVLLFVGMLRFPRRQLAGQDRARFWVDALAILLGGGAVIWYFVLGPSAARSEADPVASALSVAYPVADLLLIFGAMAVLLGRAEHVRPAPLVVLAASQVVFAVADIAYGNQQLSGEYRGGGWVDALYVAAQGTQGIAAHLAYWECRRPGAPLPVPRVGRWTPILLPLVAITISSGLLLAAAGLHESLFLDGVVVTALGTLWLLIVRQVILVRESARLQVAYEQQSTQIRAVHDAMLRVAWEADLTVLQHRMLEDARRLTRASHAALFVWDVPGDVARLVGSVPTLPFAGVAACLRLATHVAQTGMGDYSRGGDPYVPALQAALRAHSYAAIPVPGAQRLAGVLLVLRTEPAPPFTERDLAALQLYATVVTASRQVFGSETRVPARQHPDTISWVNEAALAFCREARPALAGIDGQLARALTGAATPLNRQSWQVMAGVGQTLHRLTHMLDELELAQMADRGSDARHAVATDAVKLTRSVVTAEQRWLGGHAVQVIDFKQHPLVLADPGLVERMLALLLHRAAFDSAMTDIIEVVVDRRPGQVVFEVRDSGPPISVEEQVRIWEPFYHPSGRGRDGLGLGLALIRYLAEVQGGGVWVASHPTQTRFGFWLPEATSRALMR